MTVLPKKQRKALERLIDKPWDELEREVAEEDIITWAETNMVTDRGYPVEFERHPYLVSIYEDWHPALVLYKAAQVGATQTVVGKMLFFMTKHGVNLIYIFPTEKDVDEFSSTRFKPILDKNPMLNALMKINNAGVKMIGDSKVFFRGSFNERQAISVPADALFFDELDFCKDDIVDMYSPRVSHSEWKIVWKFSTPTIKDFGVHAAYKDSDQRVWMVKCVGCRKWQQVKWSYFKYSNLFEKKTPGGRHIRWYFGCWRCEKELDRTRGMWAARHPERVKARGYHIPQTIVPVISADYMKDEEQKAIKAGRIRRFYNFNLGRYYDSSTISLTKSLIAKRSMYFNRSIYESDRWYIGVDQGDVLHWTLSRMVQGKRITVRFGKYESFDDLDLLFGEYNIAACVIDAMPNKHKAKEVRDKHPGRVWIVYYKDNQQTEYKGTLDDEEFVGTKNKETYAISVDRTETLDRSTKEWVDGVALLNASPTLVMTKTSVEGEFAEQMSNLKRDEEEDKHGNMRGVWKKTGADHFRHADNYNRLAVDILGRGSEVDIRSGGGSGGLGSFDGTPGAWTETKDGFLIPAGRKSD